MLFRSSGVLGNVGEARAGLNAMQQLLGNFTATGSGGEGARYLATVLGDLDNASKFARSLMYGSMAPSVASALGRPLAFAPTRIEQYMESVPGEADALKRTALDLLLSGLGGGAGSWQAPATNQLRNPVAPPTSLLPGGQ